MSADCNGMREALGSKKKEGRFHEDLHRRRCVFAVEHLARIIGRVRGMELVGQADDVQEATESIARLKPDVLILVLRVPDGNRIDVLKDVKSRFPNAKVIVSPTTRRSSTAGAVWNSAQIISSTSRLNSISYLRSSAC